MSWILVLAFSVGMSALLGIAAHFYNRASSAKRSVQFLGRVGSVDRAETADMLGSKPQRLATSKAVQSMLRDAPLVDVLAEMLDQSGLPTTVAGLLGQVVGLGVAVLVGALLSGVAAAPAVCMAFLGGTLPIVYVVHQRGVRATAFEQQLPQALELIGLYLRSGRSLPQAFVATTEELTPPAADEFSLVADEYRLGRPLDSSLKRLALKYPTSVGFRLFAIAVSVLGQTGGNLVEVLERIKKTLDAGVAYGLRLRALTGDARTSAWVLSLLPGIFMAILGVLNPQYLNAFFDSKMGHFFFGLMATFWAVGILWIRNLMQAKLL